MPSLDSGLQPRFAGMAQVTLVDGPGDFPVVTGAAELACRDVFHRNVIASHPHFEVELTVADFAFEPDPVEPVGENHGPHALGFRMFIEYHIRVFSLHRPCCNQNYRCQEQPCWPVLLNTSHP